MPITRGWQRDLESRAHEAHIAAVAAHTRSCGRVPCAACGLPASVYIECKAANVGTFRCRKCALGVAKQFGGDANGVIEEPIREMALDLFNELRYQGRVNAIVSEDEARRERMALGLGLLTLEELALLRIAYDRNESAESFAAKLLGGSFYLAQAGVQ